MCNFPQTPPFFQTLHMVKVDDQDDRIIVSNMMAHSKNHNPPNKEVEKIPGGTVLVINSMHICLHS